MKKTPLAVAIGLLATSASVFAAEDANSFHGFSATASTALTTDYVWRGVSQSNNDPAIQASFDLSHEMGFYAGAWASSLELGNKASMELDLYGGFANETDFGGFLPFALGYDLGVLHYEYTDESDSNFTEIYFGASVSPIENLNFSTYYYYGLKLDQESWIPGEYTDMAIDYTLPDEFGGITLLAHAGYHNQKTADWDNYWDWKIGVAKDFGGFNFEVAYIDTDDADVGNLDNARVVATVSRELGGSSAESISMLPEGWETSASAALTTDYIWRGISQTENNPAVQGSFDIGHESGFYFGVWGSNVDFRDETGAPGTASLELDAYLGFANETDFGGALPFAISYDVGYLRYIYPSEAGLDFNELYFGLGVSPVENLNLGVKYYYGLKVENTKPGEYTDMSADYTLPDEFGAITFLAHAGYYNQKTGADNYWDWKAGIAKDFGSFNFEVAYTDTDDTDAGKLDDSKVVGTISTTF